MSRDAKVTVEFSDGRTWCFNTSDIQTQDHIEIEDITCDDQMTSRFFTQKSMSFSGTIDQDPSGVFIAVSDRPLEKPIKTKKKSLFDKAFDWLESWY